MGGSQSSSVAATPVTLSASNTVCIGNTCLAEADLAYFLQLKNSLRTELNDTKTVVDRLQRQVSATETNGDQLRRHVDQLTDDMDHVASLTDLRRVQDSVVDMNGQLSALLNAIGDARNRIINGAMEVDQYNQGAPVTINKGAFVIDRWICNIKMTTLVAQGVNVPMVHPLGLAKALKLQVQTPAADPASPAAIIVGQVVESGNIQDWRWGTPAAEPATLSFWVYASAAATYGIRLQYLINGGRSDAVRVMCGALFRIAEANVWQKVSVTVDGPTVGGPSGEVLVALDLASEASGPPLPAGTTWTKWQVGRFQMPGGGQNFAATVNNTLYLTGVQFERGNLATPFEMRPPHVELTRCMRYFQRHSVSAVASFGAGVEHLGNYRLHVALPVAMRTPPAVMLGLMSPVEGAVPPRIKVVSGGKEYAVAGIAGAKMSPQGGMIDLAPSGPVAPPGASLVAYLEPPPAGEPGTSLFFFAEYK